MRERRIDPRDSSIADSADHEIIRDLRPVDIHAWSVDPQRHQPRCAGVVRIDQWPGVSESTNTGEEVGY